MGGSVNTAHHRWRHKNCAGSVRGLFEFPVGSFFPLTLILDHCSFYSLHTSECLKKRHTNFIGFRNHRHSFFSSLEFALVIPNEHKHSIYPQLIYFSNKNHKQHQSRLENSIKSVVRLNINDSSSLYCTGSSCYGT